MKYLFTDLEITLGGEIKQIFVKPCINGKMLKGINILIKYNGKGGTASQQREHNSKALTITSAFRKLIEYLQKHINLKNSNDRFMLVAHNASFDYDKLIEFFKNNRNDWFFSYFWPHPLCTLQLASAVLALTNSRDQVHSMKLKDLCAYYQIKIEEDKLHDASYDTYLLVELFKKLVNEMYRMRLNN